MYLKFRIGKDKRKLVPINGFELKDADSNNPQWLQGRQNEDGGRQVFVDLEDENGSPVNLTGASAVFKGVLPGGQYKIWDHKSSTIIDAQAGRFRYTFPKRAMAIAGSYKQAFFEIFREGTRLATLEFNFEVLADLVEENIIPSDYITPFEDLYDKLKEYLVKFNGDFEAAMTQWKKDVADLITELNADVSGINLTITEIKTQLASLEEKIKADGLATLKDIQPFIDEVTKARGDYADLADRINAMGSVDVDESIVSGEFVKSYFEPEIQRVKAELLPDVFTFTQMNDMHYETITRNKPEAYRSLNHIKNALSFADVSDLIILNGDNTNSDTASLGGVKKDVETLVDVFLDEPLDYNTDRFISLGNHDDGSTRREKVAKRFLAQDNYLHDAYFRETYRTGELLNDETRNEDSLYCFKDYPDKKIRFVLINTSDIAEGVLDADGSQKYDRWGTHTVRQEQLNWLVNVALANVPSNYHVVVMGHCPLNMNQDGGTQDPGGNYVNLDIVASVLAAFRDGAKYEGNSTDDDFPVNIVADFTTQGPRNLVGYFCGHTHKDAVTTYKGLSIIEVACSVFYNNVKSRFVETATEDGFDVIQIDTTNRNVNIHGFGYCENRSVKY